MSFALPDVLPLAVVWIPESTLSSLPIIGISLMISVLWFALFYMFGKLMDTPEIYARVEEEKNQFFTTIFIVVAVVTISATINSVISQMFCGNTTSCDLFSFAKSWIDTLRTEMIQFYVMLYIGEFMIGTVSTMSFSVMLLRIITGVFPLQFGVGPLSGVSLYAEGLITVLNWMELAIASIIMKQVILEFVEYAALSIILPLGVVLRAFPLTRTTGSSIIAFSIVLYFIVPLSFAFSNYMLFELYNPGTTTSFGDIFTSGFKEEVVMPVSLSSCDASTIEEMQNKLNELKSNISSEIEIIERETGEELNIDTVDFWEKELSTEKYLNAKETIAEKYKKSSTLSRIWEILKLISNPTAYYYYFYNQIVYALTYTSKFLVASMFSLIVEVLIIITFYRTIAMAIKGEAEIFGIGKLVKR